MYEKSRTLMDCHVAGFAHYDGIDVIEALKIGTTVTLEAEPDNPYDPDAVCILYDGIKLGYVPRAKNGFISKLLGFGYGNILEAKIVSRDLEEHPERQFRVVIRLKRLPE